MMTQEKYEEETNYQFEDHQEVEGIEELTSQDANNAPRGKFKNIALLNKLKNRRVLFVVGFERGAARR